MSNQPVAIQTDSIPDRLIDSDHWICWRTVERDGKPTKLPIDPETTETASSTDSETWSDFNTAFEQYRDSNDELDGLGYVFSSDGPFVGVDLDDCRDAETGEPAVWASLVIEQLRSYTEVSPSGTGYHILLKGELPGDRSRKGNVEMYDSHRFFTVTGDHVEDTTTEIRNRSRTLTDVYIEQLDDTIQDAIDDTQETLDSQSQSQSQSGDSQTDSETGPVSLAEAPDQTPAESQTASTACTAEGSSEDSTDSQNSADLSNDEVIEKAKAAKNSQNFTALWNGNTGGYDSHSEADLAFCNHLAFWTGADHQQMDQLFRDSGLMRPKWDEVHYADGSTYGEHTIEVAIDNATDVYGDEFDAKSDSSSDSTAGASSSSATGAEPDAQAQPIQSDAASATSGDSSSESESGSTAQVRRLTRRVTDLEEKLNAAQADIDALTDTIDELRDRIDNE